MKTAKQTKRNADSFRSFTGKFALLTLSFFVAFSLVLSAAADVTNAVDSEVVNKLLQRVEALEQKAKRVDELEAQLKALKAGESAQVSAPVERWPKVEIQVQGDIDYHVSNAKNDVNTFDLGDLDIVATGQLNEKAKVLADLVVASNHGGFALEIERLVASYRFSDYFNLDAGRFNTAMGWYNNFYHNGIYFQTAVERPRMFDFEDNVGFLPVHSTGLSLNGDIPSGTFGLSYSFEVANGRNYTANPDEALAIADDNDYKSLNGQLRAKPDWAPNWQFGVGVYHDTLTPVLDPAAAPGVTTRIDQFIFSGYAVYKGPLFDWFTEGVLIGDQPQGDQRRWTGAAYTQVSRKFGKFRPYARLQWQDAPLDDPLFILIGENTRVWGPQIGIRYDFTTMMALKLQYAHTLVQNEPAVDDFTVQWAFRF